MGTGCSCQLWPQRCSCEGKPRSLQIAAATHRSPGEFSAATQRSPGKLRQPKSEICTLIRTTLLMDAWLLSYAALQWAPAARASCGHNDASVKACRDRCKLRQLHTEVLASSGNPEHAECHRSPGEFVQPSVHRAGSLHC